jgi:hypothetical protein
MEVTMPKYNVRICWEVWNYYEIEVEAEDEDTANTKASYMIDEEDYDLGEPYDTDGNGYTIVATEEVIPE